MLACTLCGKGKNLVSFSRHKKGSSGAGGNWALRAPIHTRIQKPNLHVYKGEKFCTKCLRVVKLPYQKPAEPSALIPAIAHRALNPRDAGEHPADSK